MESKNEMPAGDTSLVMLMCEKCTFHLAIKKKPIKIFQNGFLLCTQQSVYNLNKVENKLFEIQKKNIFSHSGRTVGRVFKNY